MMTAATIAGVALVLHLASRFGAPFVAIGHEYFGAIDEFQKGMGQHGKEIMADVANYTTIQPQIQISEIIG